MYVMDSPNWGLGVAILGQEREQSRFKENSEGAKGRSKGARKEYEGTSREQGGSAVGKPLRAYNGASSLRLKLPFPFKPPESAIMKSIILYILYTPRI